MRTSFIWGIVIILIGVGLLLNNLGITNLDIGELISTYWPVIFIIWGLDIIIDRNSRKIKSNFIFGAILFILGFAIIGRNLNLFYFDFSLLWNIIWPLILILVGISILRSGAFSKKGSWAVMSGIERRQKGWKLSNQNYTAFLGGIDLDLTVADIPEEETFLELAAILGGIDIRVPDDVNISCNNTSILGGMEFFCEDSGGVFVNKV